MLVRLSSPTSPGRRRQTETIFWVANVPLLQRPEEKGLFATVGLGLAHSRNLITEPLSHPAVSAACTSYGESSQYKFTWAPDAAIAGEAQSVSQHPLTPLILIEYLIPTVSARILPCFRAALQFLTTSASSWPTGATAARVAARGSGGGASSARSSSSSPRRSPRSRTPSAPDPSPPRPRSASQVCTPQTLNRTLLRDKMNCTSTVGVINFFASSSGLPWQHGTRAAGLVHQWNSEKTVSKPQ